MTSDEPTHMVGTAAVMDPKAFRFEAVDGLQIRYLRDERAEGTPILLLGTWPESILAYAPTWAAFTSLGPVLAADLPGYGGSEGRADLMTPEAMAGFIPKLLRAFGLDRPHVVGPDIATPTSLYAALLQPRIFRSMIVGGGATDPTDIGSDLDAMVNAPSLDGLKDLTGEAFVRGAVATMEAYQIPSWIVEDYIASYAGDRFLQSVMFVRNYPTALPKLKRRMREIQTPCQIIVGGRDPYVPVSNAELIRRHIFKSRLDVLPCGHFAWEDCATAYAAIAKQWIEGGYTQL